MVCFFSASATDVSSLSSSASSAVADADAKKDGKVSEATDSAALALAKGTSTANDEKLGDSSKKMQLLQLV